MNHPSEVLEIGQKVRVKVLDVDRDRQRISLGLKQTQTDPWQRVIDETQQGDVVAGKITKVVTFGAFAEIVSGVEGLIHISELAEHHVENPREVVQQGEEVKVKIIEIDPDRRRLSLSLRRVEPDEPVKTIDLGLPGERPQAEVPELGLSEEVFAEAPAAAGRGRGAARRPPTSPQPTSRPPTSPSPMSRPQTSLLPRARRRGAGRGRAGRRGLRLAGLRKTRRRATAEASRGPVLVGLTGGIGGGKSEALRAFRRHGAVTLSSDESVRMPVRRATTSSGPCAEHFGDEVIDPDGAVDRAAIGRIVFADAERAALAGGAAPAAPGRGVRRPGATSRRRPGRGCSCTRRRRSSRSASPTATTRS